jgi:pimeloyl-ACP methyl ester carboxylesterase
VPTADLEGVRLFWEERGTGPPVLFVHGIPTDYRAWAAQQEGLSPEFRTVTYSRRYAYPNSRTGDLSDSTVENNAADLGRLIEKLGIAPVNLVGHSYGGFIAAELALTRPELVRSLVLVEPAIASLLLRHPSSRGEAVRLLLRHPRVALSASRFLRRSNGPALEALTRNDLPNAVRFNVDGIEARDHALDRFPETVRQMMLDNARTVKETDTPYPAITRRQLGGIRLPTLVLHGETSALWLRAIAQMTGASIPGSTTLAVPSTGHFPHLQNPTPFNAALAEFLKRA